MVRWPCPGADGPDAESAVAFDRGRARRVLIVPALFEEMNRTRRLLVETMRRLDAAGIDTVMPDLPGCGESLQDFARQSLHGWRTAMAQAARHFAASHVLAVRGGALVFPNALPGWVLEPISGAAVLRPLLRAQALATGERVTDLMAHGLARGLDLAGYPCGAGLIAGLETAVPLDEGQREIRQSALGGSALWLRSEPGEDPGQADALAALIAGDLAADGAA